MQTSPVVPLAPVRNASRRGFIQAFRADRAFQAEYPPGPCAGRRSEAHCPPRRREDASFGNATKPRKDGCRDRIYAASGHPSHRESSKSSTPRGPQRRARSLEPRLNEQPQRSRPTPHTPEWRHRIMAPRGLGNKKLRRLFHSGARTGPAQPIVPFWRPNRLGGCGLALGSASTQ